VRNRSERDVIAMQYGIWEKLSIFDNVMCDCHLQCPHDAFYYIGDLAKEML